MNFIKPTILIAGLAIAMGTSAYAQTGTGIATPGSAHNFVDGLGHGSAAMNEIGANGWNSKRKEICRVCHVPHDHQRAGYMGDKGLLWNHALSDATYVLYTSDTLDNIVTQPTGYSKMCLGCHDGTVAIDAFDGKPGGNNTGGTAVNIMDYPDDGFMVPGANNASSLTHSHPYSVVYDSTIDPGLHPKTDDMGASGTIEDVLEGGTIMQCSTCHDVHDQPGESVTGTHLLRVVTKATDAIGTNASALCLTCHIK